MNGSYIATAVALRDLKCYCIDTISDRILLQKKIYLAQNIGLPLGYGYSWYIHGPYSSDLTNVAYQIVPEGTEAIERHRFKEHFMGIIKKINDLEYKISTYNLKIDVVSWYEMLASIAYLEQQGVASKTEICEKMALVKPQFSKELVGIGYDIYSEIRLSD